MMDLKSQSADRKKDCLQVAKAAIQAKKFTDSHTTSLMQILEKICTNSN